MRYHLPNLWLSRSGVIPLPARRRAETDLGLRRYMLEVYDYVACGLAVTGVGAYAVTVSGFHASMMDQTPPFLMPFMWILLLAPLALVMLLWLSIDEMSFFAAQATVWACAALTGFTFECISLVYTGGSLAPLSFIAAATFSAMSVYGYFTRTDLSKSRHFLGMGVVGVVLAGLVNFFLERGNQVPKILAERADQRGAIAMRRLAGDGRLQFSEVAGEFAGDLFPAREQEFAPIERALAHARPGTFGLGGGNFGQEIFVPDALQRSERLGVRAGLGLPGGKGPDRFQPRYQPLRGRP